MKHPVSLPVSALIATILFSNGCSKPVESSKDIAHGRSLVIAKIYESHVGETGISSTYFVPIVRDRLSPEKRELTSIFFRSRGDSYAADDAAPGRYRFKSFENLWVGYGSPPYYPRYEVDIGEGEAVYIGDLFITSNDNRFKIVIADRTDLARPFFDQRFGDSGLKFTTRLLREFGGE